MHTVGAEKIPWDDIWDFQYYRVSCVRMRKYRVRIIDPDNPEICPRCGKNLDKKERK